jgi:hypothetical protein
MRLLSIPAGIIGIVLALAFFTVYGMVTKPAVPTPVAFVVNQFAPGVRIGATVAEVKRHATNLTWVPHVGFVGKVPAHVASLPTGMSMSFPQIRLVLGAKARSGPQPAMEKARIEAVELVTSESGAYPDLASALTGVFRAVPRVGCLRLPGEGGMREVHYWMTRRQEGGVALLSDYAGTSADAYGGLNLVSVIAFLGEFRGARTLRANFADGSCDQFPKAN